MVVPMKRQYEQQCNAVAIHRLGVPVIHNLSPKSFPAVEQWLQNNDVIKVQFPKETAAIAVSKMVEDFIHRTADQMNQSLSKF